MIHLGKLCAATAPFHDSKIGIIVIQRRATAWENV